MSAETENAPEHGYEIVYEPKVHRCSLPGVAGWERGTVLRCIECGEHHVLRGGGKWSSRWEPAPHWGDGPFWRSLFRRASSPPTSVTWGGGIVDALTIDGKEQALCEHSQREFGCGDEIHLVDCPECGGWLIRVRRALRRNPSHIREKENG